VFEFERFHSGTQAITQAVAACKGFTLAGGGDTIAAIEKYHFADRIDYISTVGGAALDYVELKESPAIAALKDGEESPGILFLLFSNEFNIRGGECSTSFYKSFSKRNFLARVPEI
jgi:hypothetical protein